MNETPETDALVASINSDTDIVRHEHDFCEMTWLARRLERERDEARKIAEQMSESNQVLLAEIKHYREIVECATPASNESNLKLVLEEVAKLAKTLKAERDEARNELLKCNEYNDELYRKLKTK